MEYHIRKAIYADLERIEAIYTYARKFMAETGNPHQWGSTTPLKSQLEDDIRKGDLYVLIHDNSIHGVFYFYIGDDPTYGSIEDGYWRSDTPYGTIHRIAGDGSGGVLAAAVCLSIRNCIKRAPKSTVPGQHRFGFEKPYFCSL